MVGSCRSLKWSGRVALLIGLIMLLSGSIIQSVLSIQCLDERIIFCLGYKHLLVDILTAGKMIHWSGNVFVSLGPIIIFCPISCWFFSTKVQYNYSNMLCILEKPEIMALWWRKNETSPFKYFCRYFAPSMLINIRRQSSSSQMGREGIAYCAGMA
jgi:hypothetical protein